MVEGDRTESGQRRRDRLVVNADDFGRTEAINAAVAQAHARGILTSASLMVTHQALFAVADPRGCRFGKDAATY
jgi:hypothetical protein